MLIALLYCSIKWYQSYTCFTIEILLVLYLRCFASLNDYLMQLLLTL